VGMVGRKENKGRLERGGRLLLDIASILLLSRFRGKVGPERIKIKFVSEKGSTW